MNALTRRGFLASSGALAAAGAMGVGEAVATPARKARRLISVFVPGGWDISYALDPKTGISPEGGTIQTFGDIPILTDANRPAVTTFFEKFFPMTAVVHGIRVGSISHRTCERKMFTGLGSGAGPDAAAIVANAHARDYALPYLVVGSHAYSGPLGVITGRVGSRAQINALLDPADRYPRDPDSPFFHQGFEPSGGDEDRIRAFALARAERERATRGQFGYNRARVDDFVESLGKGDLLRANAAPFGQRGDDLSLADQVALGITALQEDLSWSISISNINGFDTHDDNSVQVPRHQQLFTGLTALGDFLESSGMMDDTIVAVFSEMSRTPGLNETGGKDHHGVTSAFVFGGGVAGGRTYGANDASVQAVPVNFATGETSGGDTKILEPKHLVAGLAELAGADPSDQLDADPFTAFIA